MAHWSACKISSATTITTGTETQQNVWIGRWLLVVVCTGLLGEGASSSRTEARVTERSRATKAWGARLISKLGSECQYHTGFHRWLCVYANDRGGKWHLPTPFFMKTPPYNPCLFGMHSEMSKYLTPLCPRYLSNCWFCVVSAWAICHAVFSRARTQLPNTLWAHSELGRVIFKIPGFMSTWF